LNKNIIFLALLIILPLRIFSDTRIDSLFYNFSSLKGKDKLQRILAIEEFYAEQPDSLILKYYKEALNLSSKLSDNDSYFEAKEIMAGYYFYKSDYHKVINLLREVTNYQQSINNPNIADYTMLAFAFYKQKEYEKVLENYTKATKTVKEKDKIGQGLLENLMGVTYCKLEFNKEAKERFLNAIEIYKQENAIGSLSVSYNNLALVFAKENNFQKAIEYTEKSIALNEKNNNRYGIAISKLNIGSYYLSEKKYQQAKTYLSKSEKLLIELGEKIKLANVYRYFGKIFFKQKKYLEAKKYLLKSIKLLKNNKFENAKIFSYKTLAKVENHLNKPRKADSIFTKTIELINQNARINLNNNISQTKAKISFLDKNQKIQQSKEVIKYNNIQIKKRQDLIYFISILLIISIIFFFISRKRLRIIKNLNNELIEKNKQLEATLELNNNILNEKILLIKNNAFLAMGITMNHEITQPLMVIQGNIDMMKMNPKFEENPDIASNINNIEKSILRMKDILAQMKEMEEI
jgi:tetratricopeptide (TPR) repeat protein